MASDRIKSRLYMCPTCRKSFHPWKRPQRFCSRKCDANSPAGRERLREIGAKGGPIGGEITRQRFLPLLRGRSSEYRAGYRAGYLKAYNAGKRAGWAEACGEKEIPTRWLGMERRRGRAA